MRVVKTVCGMCGGDNCGIDVYLQGERIVEVRGTRECPMNRGRLCPQARAAIEMTYDRERLQYPMRREGSSWSRISWNQALDVIAEKLSLTKDRHGAQALAVYQGRALLQLTRDGWVRRFMSLYGTPNLVRNEHMCAAPLAIGEKLTYGTPTLYYGLDADNVRCVVLWGSNPVTSHLPTVWPRVTEAQKRGAKLIVIDPRFTQPAARADLYASPRPGTDLALALGLIHVIVTEGLCDTDFVRRWTVGLERLAERVAEYTPTKVASITGVPAESIQRIAHTYASLQPAYLDAGNALEHHSNSGQTVRAVAILRALTGSLDVPGGHLFPQDIPLADVALREKQVPGLKPLGWDRHPLVAEMGEFVPGDSLLLALLERRPYAVRAMIMAGGNPMLTWPNTNVMQKALASLDFLVVSDLYMTETAKMADIVLPAADPFERTQLIVWSGFFGTERPTWYVGLRPKVKEGGERRSDWWFWRSLACRMGYERHFPWADEEEAIDYQLRPLGIGIQYLKDNPGGIYWGEGVEYRKYERDGFRTPTGKVELYSHVLESYGYDPLPTWEEPFESPSRTPDLAERFPLVLNAGHRVAAYTHSRHRNLSSLRVAEPIPRAEISPETASKIGIKDGDRVAIETLRGRIETEARVVEGMHPGIVSVLHGWAEANVNLLTDHASCDPIVASPPLRASLCSVGVV
jgi:anaerobic selenocysteine-containing dehydrogenase